MTKTRIGVAIFGAVMLIYAVVRLIVPPILEQNMNQIDHAQSLEISQPSLTFHNTLFVGDWHADSTLWDRDLAKLSDFGHVDIPRLQQGNVALQMFTTVTKSPDGLNYEQNSVDAPDNITKLALVQGWPLASLTSLTQRALYQASKLHTIAKKYPQQFMLIRSQTELSDFLTKRQSNPTLVGGLIGAEGAHALDGKLENIDVLYQAGFRMIGLQHFFDNQLGGSLHGISRAGLTEFGRKALSIMQSKGMIIDLSHSSQQTVLDVLEVSKAPLVISHTGFNGHCPNQRNIDDSLMKAIADNGGMIAVGYWVDAACGIQPDDIADAIIYGINLVGEDHVALGSDYDGTVIVSFATNRIALITQALQRKSVPDAVIAKVMGANMLRFLQHNLPSD
ncbi:dipeptidase [Aliiglaciecola litoralis]|uniref:Membrane dipeptidase n=1 Tax=Aliiglaciecola litoralis TaxID=582857 RepID=A0ABN1LJ28_9ALTE